MKKIPTSLPGMFILEPRVFGDDRGFFLESYNDKVMDELGVTEIHLCEHALDKLMRSLQGLYSTPITDMTEIDAGWAGRLCGIKFYRDLNE